MCSSGCAWEGGPQKLLEVLLHFVLVPSVFTLSFAPNTKTENQSQPQHLLHYVLNCDKGPWRACTLSPGRSFDHLSSASQSTRSHFTVPTADSGWEQMKMRALAGGLWPRFTNAAVLGILVNRLVVGGPSSPTVLNPGSRVRSWYQTF